MPGDLMITGETTLRGRKIMRKSRLLRAKKGKYGETVGNDIQCWRATCANVCFIKSLGRFGAILRGVEDKESQGQSSLKNPVLNKSEHISFILDFTFTILIHIVNFPEGNIFIHSFR